MTKNKHISLAIILGLSLFLTIDVFAESNTKEKDNLNMTNPFTEQSIKVNNVGSEASGTVELTTKKNSEAEFSIDITNKTKEKKDYQAALNKETTNGQGKLVYSDNEQNSSGAHPLLGEMVTIDRSFSIEHGATYNLKAKVKFDDEFLGDKFGAIVIYTKDKDDKNKTYNIPVIIHGAKMGETPNGSINKIEVNKTLTSINVSGSNLPPNRRLKSKLEVKFINKKTGDTKLKLSKDADLAAEANFSISTNARDEVNKLRSGNYLIEAKVKNDKGLITNAKEQEFKITKKHNYSKLLIIPAAGLIVSFALTLNKKRRK